ncbi:polysaccharide pyruvyl transferase family protein [Chitinispirillales bacterium ANBcel5]|uniref:polysaccharide pyruvyl transferase family protein n=1 Tax=Cellulosispirillum alkaliphilum TaxID=3039283 RepID=UPI002A4F06F3|nr:polysaccharide pyruvyl transferase family protein [Chitinispirillales bacterium ANBcel5]
MKNKSVGILNMHSSNSNYGAVLQAVAIQECVNRLGYSSEHIDLIIPLTDESIWRQLYDRFKKQVKVLLGMAYNVRGQRVFQEFRDKYLALTDHTFYTMQDLDKHTFTYDAIVVGSDQVWRPKYTKTVAMAYFLPFVGSPVRKIAYAASFGVSRWEEFSDTALTTKVGHLLQKFDSVSVREDSGVEICKDVFTIKAQHVLDPTLLIGADFFKKTVLKEHTTNDYDGIVYYKLDRSQDFLNLLSFLGKKYSCCTKNIYHKKVSKRLREYIPVSQWLNAIHNSTIVVTDSFHCICFAIMFNKEFIYYGNEQRGITRAQSLLKMLGITGRMISSFDTEKVEMIVRRPIDYKTVNSKLDQFREESAHFLAAALNEKIIPADKMDELCNNH